MDRKVAIITDSACDLSEEQIRENHIYMVPLRMSVAGREYRDRVDIDADTIYDMMATTLPKTSLPDAEDVRAAYDLAMADGCTEGIHLSISSGLSGAMNVVSLVAAEHPMPIRVVDTLTLSAAEGMLVLEAARMAREGAATDDIVERVRRIRQKQLGMFVIKTLEYLRKGGRIGLVEGAIGQLLQIQPIVFVNDDGVYQTLAKSRGRKNSVEKMFQAAITRYARQRVRLWVVHGRAQDEAEALMARLRETLDVAFSCIAPVSPALGVHTGPGLLGIILAPAEV